MPSVMPISAFFAAFLARRSAFFAACAAFLACLAISFSLTIVARLVLQVLQMCPRVPLSPPPPPPLLPLLLVCVGGGGGTV